MEFGLITTHISKVGFYKHAICGVTDDGLYEEQFTKDITLSDCEVCHAMNGSLGMYKMRKLLLPKEDKPYTTYKQELYNNVQDAMLYGSSFTKVGLHGSPKT